MSPAHQGWFRPAEARTTGLRTSVWTALVALLLAVTVTALARREASAPAEGAPSGLAAGIGDLVRSGPDTDDPVRALDPGAAAALAAAVRRAAVGDPPEPPPGYEVIDTWRPVVVLAETPVAGRRPGEGVYAVRPEGLPVAVQVPHPRDDLFTVPLGVELFDRVGARALLVSGSSRGAGEGAADTSHSARTFTAVSSALAEPGWAVVQVHGFDPAAHPGVGDAVVSSTTPTPSVLTRLVAQELTRAGLTVCVYDGERCAELAGTRNGQAAGVRAAGADFVHVELAEPHRRDARRRARVVEALATALSRYRRGDPAAPTALRRDPPAGGTGRTAR